MYDDINNVFNNLISCINPLDRKNLLISLKNTIKKYEMFLYNAIKIDLNKSEYETYLTEISLVYEELTYFIKNTIKLSRPKKVRSCIAQIPSKAYIYNEPFGKVLIISPWNYPIQLALIPLVGALAGGNSTIIKPSEYTPNTSLVLQKIVDEALPKNVCQVILGDKDVSNYLSQLKFDKIFFTGSSNVGKIICENASKNLVPVVLELGGKSPVLIFDTKDINLAAKRLVFAKWLNAGQTCVAPDYVFIKKEYYNDFIKYLEIYINKYINLNIKNNLYPKIITNRHLERLLNLFDKDTVLNDYYLDSENHILGPVLVKEDNLDSKLMSEEIFGPILPIITIDNLDNAISYIKSKDKPLALYIFSDNKDKTNQLLQILSYGSACVNDAVVQITVPSLPFGGIGGSGMGNYHGHYSYKAFTHEKSVLVRQKYLDLELRYPPYSKKTTLIKKILK